MIELDVPYKYKHNSHSPCIIFTHLYKSIYTYKIIQTGAIYQIPKHSADMWFTYMEPLTEEEKLELL